MTVTVTSGHGGAVGLAAEAPRGPPPRCCQPPCGKEKLAFSGCICHTALQLMVPVV